MPDILELKEGVAIPPIVILCRLDDNKGQVRHWSTAGCQEGSISYEKRLLWEAPNSWKLVVDPTQDGAGSIVVLAANADGLISQLNREGALNGASLQVWAGTLNGDNVEAKVPVWNGLLSGVSSLDDRSARLTVVSRLSAMRSSFPPMRIQRTCAWSFPANAEQRQQACSSGEDGRYDSSFRCGYSPDVEGGVGNLDSGGQPFTTCDYSRGSCEARGMFATDGANRPTRRFSGVEYVPPSILVRGYGESSGRLSNLVQLEAKFNDIVPVVYGMGWLQAPVVFSRNDGNLTHAEVLLGLGEIDSIVKVVVNGYEIPQGISGKNMTSTGWYNLVSKGNRTGSFNLDFANSSSAPQGDPYGSMAFLSVVVPNAVSTGKSAPKVEVLMRGVKVPVLDATGALVAEAWSQNPAWILCDMLRRCGWKLDELDLPSIIYAAGFCDEIISGTTFDGTPISVPRFKTNLVITRKYSLGELLRSVRLAAMLQLRLSAEGKLQIVPETTLANSQSEPMPGGNSTEAVLSGWPVYEFGDGVENPGGILLKPNGEPDFRMSAKASSECPNRVNFEFQDELNEFRQDSISIADHEDIRMRRQEIVQNLPVIGVPNELQAQRVCQNWLNKSLSGNVYVEFRTSFRGMHIRPGDLIALTYAKYGLDRALFRVLEVEMDSLLRWVRISAQIHMDYWYSDSAALRYDSLRRYAWNNSKPRSVVGTLVTAGEVVFDATESLLVRADNSRACALAIPYLKPPTSEGCQVSIPKVSFHYALLSGGSLAANTNYFYQVTAMDSAGIESAPSSLIPVYSGNGSSPCSVQLQGLSVSAGTVAMNIYRGRSPHRLVRVASGVAPGSEWTDTGLPEMAAVAPDGEFRGVRAYWRQIFSPAFQAQTLTETEVGRSDLGLEAGKWVGKKLFISSGRGAGQERAIRNNTETLVEVERGWTIAPDSTSRFMLLDAGWTLAQDSDTGLLVVELPPYGGQSFQVSLRTIARDGSEQNYFESPVVNWQVGVGSTSGGDLDVPTRPEFSFRLTGDGTLVFAGLSFFEPQNLRTVYAGKLGLYFWDELRSPTTLSLDATLTATATEVNLTSLPSGVEPGFVFQLGRELLQVSAVSTELGTATVVRGRFDTLPGTHAAGKPLFPLQKREHLFPFVEGYFTSEAAADFEYSFRMPNVRIAAADFVLYNRIGPSAISEGNLTAIQGDGVRTLSGGQLLLSSDGYLSIQASAGSFAVVDRQTVIGNVYAYVREAPQGAPINLLLRVNDEVYCSLEILAEQFSSSMFSGFNLPPIPEGSRISLDIVNVPPAASGSPGRDLTVLLQV